jgi:hypothetical protein
MTDAQHVQDAFDRAYRGGPERHRAKAIDQGKLPVRERVARLLDDGSFSEDALLANWEADGLGADGVVTGMGTVGGRTVALMAGAMLVVGLRPSRPLPPAPDAGAPPPPPPTPLAEPPTTPLGGDDTTEIHRP